MSDGDALETILLAHRRRLDALLEVQARMGIDTPAQVAVEISEIRRVLERAKSVVASPMAQTLDVASPGQRTELLSNEVRWAVDRLSSQIDTKLGFLDERIDTLQTIVIVLISVLVVLMIAVTVLVVDMAYGRGVAGALWNIAVNHPARWRWQWPRMLT